MAAADLESGRSEVAKKPVDRLPGLSLPLYRKRGVVDVAQLPCKEPPPAELCMCTSHVHTGAQLIATITLLWSLASAVHCFSATSERLTCTEGLLGLLVSTMLLAGNRRSLWPYYLPFLIFFSVDVLSWLLYAFYLMLFDLVEWRMPPKADLLVLFKPADEIDASHRLVFAALLVVKSTAYVYMLYVVARGMLFLKGGGRHQEH